MERAEDCSNDIVYLEELQANPENIIGDTIGDTVYSERFVLRLLLKLSQFKECEWNADLEDDLCVLWDMTASKDVVFYLMEHNSLELFAAIIQCTTNPRTLEILIGILGNMCCEKTVRNELAKHSLIHRTLLGHLASSDSSTVIQLLRLLRSVTWDLLKPDPTDLLQSEPHWFEKHLEGDYFVSQISYILASSTNDELLSGTLIFLSSICDINNNDKDFSQYFAIPELVDSMLECWAQLFADILYDVNLEFPNKQTETCAHNWISILEAFTGHLKGRLALGNVAHKLSETLMTWLEIPKDGSKELIISVISLLEAVVEFSFLPVAFTKTLKVVHRCFTSKDGSGDSISEQSKLEKITLKETFRSYCLAVRKNVATDTLDKALNLNKTEHITLFWSVVNESESD